MKVWVGDIVKNEVTRSGKNKTQIAKDIGRSRTLLNNILDEEYMELDYVLKIGKSIRHDFTDQLPELNKYVFQEEEVHYDTFNKSELKNELLDLQRKYISLQEAHIQLLNEVRGFDRQKSTV